MQPILTWGMVGVRGSIVPGALLVQELFRGVCRELSRPCDSDAPPAGGTAEHARVPLLSRWPLAGPAGHASAMNANAVATHEECPNDFPAVMVAERNARLLSIIGTSPLAATCTP